MWDLTVESAGLQQAQRPRSHSYLQPRQWGVQSSAQAAWTLVQFSFTFSSLCYFSFPHTFLPKHLNSPPVSLIMNNVQCLVVVEVKDCV